MKSNITKMHGQQHIKICIYSVLDFKPVTFVLFHTGIWKRNPQTYW